MTTTIEQEQLSINDVYKHLALDLTEEQFESLKESIREHGQLTPIEINQQGVILDGHNRYRACRELGINPKVIMVNTENDLQERTFIVHMNLKRRHYTEPQKVLMGQLIEELEAEKARKRMSQGGSHPKKEKEEANNNNKGVSIDTPLLEEDEKGRAANKAAREVGLSPSTYNRGRVVIERGSPEIKKRYLEGQLSTWSAYNKVGRAQHRSKAVADAASVKLPNNCKLVCAPFQNSTEEDDSLDLIFSDPPYTADALPVYRDLALLAMRKLKPGGSIVVYAGHHMLHEILDVYSDPLSRCHNHIATFLF